MKISELINRLEITLKDLGDIEVVAYDKYLSEPGDQKYKDVKHVGICPQESDKRGRYVVHLF